MLPRIRDAAAIRMSAGAQVGEAATRHAGAVTQPHPVGPSTPVPTTPDAPAANGTHRQCTPWAVAVLLVGTFALAGYLVLVVAAAALAASFAAALGLLDRVPPLDVPRLLADVAPGVLVGWGVGLVTARALSGGAALGHRLAGVASGVLGCVVGAAVLRATGVV